MIIAAVLDQEKKIVPIVEGTIVRIYDTQSKEHKDYENPALHLKEGRRGAALIFAEEKGATAFVAPPQTFCELSYAKAKKDEIHFFQIDNQIAFHEFLELVENDQLHIKNELPSEDIAPSHVPK